LLPPEREIYIALLLNKKQELAQCEFLKNSFINDTKKMRRLQKITDGNMTPRECARYLSKIF